MSKWYKILLWVKTTNFLNISKYILLWPLEEETILFSSFDESRDNICSLNWRGSGQLGISSWFILK